MVPPRFAATLLILQALQSCANAVVCTGNAANSCNGLNGTCTSTGLCVINSDSETGECCAKPKDCGKDCSCTSDLDPNEICVGDIGVTALTDPPSPSPAKGSTCPIVEPSPGDNCTGNSTCTYGEECCCGDCSHSYECTCNGGTYGCRNTDFCFAPPCNTLSPSNMPSVSPGGNKTACPIKEPSTGDTCTGTSTCKYGEECCCGDCSHSYECTCNGGTYACLATDFCFSPPCATSGPTFAPSDMPTKSQTSLSPSNMPSDSPGGNDTSCPILEPVSGDTCTGNSTCKYGEECCCGDCSHSNECTCDGGTYICLATDFCERPPCATSGSTFAPSDMPTKSQTSLHPSNMPSVSPGDSDTACPIEEPNPGDACTGNSTCKYGEECCCGDCSHSYECTCNGGIYGCLNTDFCFAPPCLSDAPSDMPTKSQTLSPSNMPSVQPSSSVVPSTIPTEVDTSAAAAFNVSLLSLMAVALAFYLGL